MFDIIQFDKEEQYVNDFLSLPSLIYTKKEITQNYNLEKQILLEQHVLSKYFFVYKFNLYENNKVVARCIITIYDDDTVAYFGFFETKNNILYVDYIFEHICKFLKTKNIKTILGPVDCSFWIRYRLKVNKFDKPPYFNEPYNKDYYFDLLKQANFEVCQSYISNQYKKVPLVKFKDDKTKKRFTKFCDSGYKIISPNKDEFDFTLKSIYKLLIELYVDFPVFKPISEEDFLKTFDSLRYIIDYKFLKLAYYNNQVVGFFVVLPDYQNILAKKINVMTSFKVITKKIRCSNYVMLYMGVKAEHIGLGNAMTYVIMKNLKSKRATSIGAFIKVGKVTGKYVKKLIDYEFEYVLMQKNLGDL